MKVQWAVQDADSGALMGYPNSVLDSYTSAAVSLAWMQSEQLRKAKDFEDDPTDKVAAESWSRVEKHRYRIVRREVGPWEEHHSEG